MRAIPEWSLQPRWFNLFPRDRRRRWHHVPTLYRAPKATRPTSALRVRRGRGRRSVDVATDTLARMLFYRHHAQHPSARTRRAGMEGERLPAWNDLDRGSWRLHERVLQTGRWAMSRRRTTCGSSRTRCPNATRRCIRFADTAKSQTQAIAGLSHAGSVVKFNLWRDTKQPACRWQRQSHRH